MNPVNRKSLLYAMCILSLYPGSVVVRHGAETGSNLTCTDVIKTRVVSALSIDEISKLGDGLSLQNDFGGLTFQPFDDDDRPRHGREIELGFILARSGDLGGTPVGLILWSERNLSFSFRKSSESTISVESSDLSKCHVLATFAFNDKGQVLRDKKVVAQAH